MPVPDFSPGEVLTAGAMDSIGMWLVGTFTLSGSETNCNNIFSSNYTNYRVVLDSVGITTQGDLQMQLRTVASPASGNDYNFSYAGTNFSASIGATNTNNTNRVRIGFFDGNLSGGASMDIYGPALPQRTSSTIQSIQPNVQQWSGGFYHNVTTAYTGLRFFSSTTMAGTVRVYGYRD